MEGIGIIKGKTMKVALTDIYSNRSLTFRVKCKKLYDCYVSKWSWLSPYQRKKAEDFFGKENAYHTHISIEC